MASLTKDERKARLTFSEYAGLINRRISTIHFERARIQRNGDSLLMSGPSGEHTLAIDATDHERCNAHWIKFATHSANRYSK